MPNWAYNKVFVSAKKKLIDKILVECYSESADGDKYFDFNKIIPEDHSDPKYKCHNVKVEYIDQAQADGTTKRIKLICCDEHITLDDENDPFNWYNWHCDHWGTKWNSCDNSVERTDDENVILSFDTAWSAPIPVIEKFCKMYPDAIVNYQCTEESEAFAIVGSSDDNGEFSYETAVPSSFVTEERVKEAVEQCFEDEGMSMADYNIDKLVQALVDRSVEDVNISIDDYDFDGGFAEPTLLVDAWSDFAKAIRKFKKRKPRAKKAK